MQHQSFFGVLGFWFGFFGLGYQLFSLARHTLVKTTLGTAHIQIHAVSEARALAGWIPYNQSPQLVRPSLEPQDCAPSQAPRRHHILVWGASFWIFVTSHYHRNTEAARK